MTGADAFAEIDTWRRYAAVLELANFVVVARPGHQIGALRSRLPALADRMVNAGTPPGRQPSIYLLETSTPDVSSTAVRERLRRGESVTGLVPALVETHIIQHRLYSSTEPMVNTAAANELHGQN